MSEYIEQARLRKVAQHARDEEYRVLNQISLFYQRHQNDEQAPLDCQANTAAIRAYLGTTEQVTEENLEGAFQHTTLFNRLAKTSPADSRAKVEQELLDLLEGSSPGTAAHEKMKFKYLSTDDLREKIADIKNARAARAKSPAVLRAEIQASKPTRPALPDHITREALLGLYDASQIRQLIDRYGAAAVTDRLNDRKSK
jgi:hypothetical protein